MSAATIAMPSVYRSFRANVTPRTVAVWLGLATLILVGIVGPALWDQDPDAIGLRDRLAGPALLGGSWDHPLGTDSLGRDILARTLAGARISLAIAAAATLLAGSVGTVLGLVSGFRGGRWDTIATWLGDVQLATPFVVIAIGLAATFEPSATTVILVLGATGWATYSRVARLAAQPLRSAGFVESARISGASGSRIVFRHILPVILPTMLALACQQAGSMLLYEAALSYLGLGVPAETITWGGMVADSRETAQVAPWATIVPGTAIVLMVIAFNAAGRVLTRRLVGYGPPV
ncbi:MAG: ABC transporter permease [Chloroflexota bacterium]|nr:ABC transporter permease [Chloroflexota bacterium]